MRMPLFAGLVWLVFVGSTVAQNNTAESNALPVLIPNLERIIDT